MDSGQITKEQITGGNKYAKRHTKYETYQSILTDSKYSSNAARLKQINDNKNFFKAMFNSKSTDLFISPEPFLGK